MAQEYTEKQLIQAGKDLVDLLLNLAKSNNNLTGFIKEYLIHLTSSNGIYKQQQDELMNFAASSDTVHRSIADNSKLSAEKLAEICKEFANMKKLYKQATTKLPSHIIAALDTNNTEKWAEWIDLSTDSVSLYDTMANYDVDIHLVTEDLHFDFLGDSSHIDRVVLVAYDIASDRVLYKNIRTPNKGEIEGFFKD